MDDMGDVQWRIATSMFVSELGHGIFFVFPFPRLSH
jgi:hypothetical protein